MAHVWWKKFKVFISAKAKFKHLEEGQRFCTKYRTIISIYPKFEIVIKRIYKNLPMQLSQNNLSILFTKCDSNW